MTLSTIKTIKHFVTENYGFSIIRFTEFTDGSVQYQNAQLSSSDLTPEEKASTSFDWISEEWTVDSKANWGKAYTSTKDDMNIFEKSEYPIRGVSINDFLQKQKTFNDNVINSKVESFNDSEVINVPKSFLNWLIDDVKCHANDPEYGDFNNSLIVDKMKEKLDLPVDK